LQASEAVRGQLEAGGTGADIVLHAVVVVTLVRAALGRAVVHGARGIERATSNQEPLEQDSFLELEVVAHGVSDVGGLDGEGDGNVSFLEDVVDLEVADHASTSEFLNRYGEFLHLL